MSIASFKVIPLSQKNAISWISRQSLFLYYHADTGEFELILKLAAILFYSIILRYRVNVITNIFIIMISPVSKIMVILLWFRNCLYIFYYLFLIVSCIFNDFIIFFLWFDIVAIHWYYHLVYITWVCLYCLFVVCLNYYTVLPMNDQFII